MPRIRPAADPPPDGRPAEAPVLRFPTFEGLRALAAVAVLVFHAATFTTTLAGESRGPAELGAWIQNLNVGVSLFFVLSGFLLFRPFVLAHLTGAAGPATRPYLLRRLVRIFPAYWVALFVSARVLSLDLGDAWSQLRYYALLQIYSGDTVLGGLPHAWSLCTELSFYLFLPVWAAAMGRVGGTVERRARAHAVGLVAWYLVAVATRWWLRAGEHAIGYATLPANTDLFAIGMALALAHSWARATGRGPGRLLVRIGDRPGLAWSAAAASYLLAVSFRFPRDLRQPTVAQELLHQALFGLIAGLIVATGVFGPQDRGWSRRVLRSWPVWALGVVSYGVYLWHLTVIGRLSHHPELVGGPSLLPLTSWALLVTTAIAAASWFGLERPLLRRVRRRAQNRPSSRVGA